MVNKKRVEIKLDNLNEFEGNEANVFDLLPNQVLRKQTPKFRQRPSNDNESLKDDECLDNEESLEDCLSSCLSSCIMIDEANKKSWWRLIKVNR